MGLRVCSTNVVRTSNKIRIDIADAPLYEHAFVVDREYAPRPSGFAPDTDDHNGHASIVAGKVGPFERRMRESDFMPVSKIRGQRIGTCWP